MSQDDIVNCSVGDSFNTQYQKDMLLKYEEVMKKSEMH